MGGLNLGRMIFPVNAGQTESDFVDGTTYDYDGRNSGTIKGKAYHSVSVNPIITATNLSTENSIDSDDTTNNVLVNSAIFTEIRNGSHGGSISNDGSGTIGNRLLPTNTTLTSYALNRDETHPFKVKVFDSSVTATETNRKFIYSTSDYPASNEVGLDIENYDYFILLNPEITSVGNNTVRPHFAKVTRIVAFDDFGDGLEFSPEYPTSIPANTKLEIFKGPAKYLPDGITEDTSVVAVSYGLRGDTDANTPKYDEVSVVSRPTFYFYNDRLDEKDHLDYATKYTLTSMRWWNYSTNITVTDCTAHSAFDVGSSSKYFVLSSKDDWDKLTEGQSIYDNSNNLLGNVESKYQQTSYRFYLDYARVGISAISSGTVTHKIGKTAQNVVFRTESKFNSKIENLGRFRLDATLVDANKNTDDSDNNFDSIRWHKAFPNMHRHTGDLVAASSNLDGDLTGPSKYLTFEKSQMKNDKVPSIQDAILNSPRNRMTKMLTFSAFDTNGMQHLKIRNGEKIRVRNSIYNSSFQMKEIKGNVTKRIDLGVHSFDITELEDKDIDLRSFLSENSIVLIDDYYYVINVVGAKANATPLKQNFSIKAKRAKTANTWTVTAEGETISNKTLYIAPYTSGKVGSVVTPVLNFDFTSDTKVDINKPLVNTAGTATGEYMITMNGNSIDKENTKLYNSRFTVGKYNSHVNEIDYSDRDNKYLKLKNDTRAFYQSTGRLMYYYTGDYVLHEEVFSGEIESSSPEFVNGMSTYTASARDDISRTLTQVIEKNLNYSKDICLSSFTKLAIDSSQSYTADTGNISVSTNIVTALDNNTFPSELIEPHTILLTPENKFIGMVKSVSYNVSLGVDYIYLYNNAPTNTVGNHASIRYYRPFNSDDPNKITGLKAIQKNTTHTNTVSDYTSLSEKGLIFDKSLELTYDGAGNAASDFTHTSLAYSSNVGSYITSRGLGYDISSPGAISTDDSIFTFNIGNENGVTSTKTDVTMLNSESFDVVDVETLDEGNTVLTIAPTFPVILGRIDTNTSDSRGNCKVYMVNNNINTGGYLHRLQNIHEDLYGSDDVIRYWDLQQFSPGNLTRTYDSIYYEGRTPQKLQGYAVGYGAYADGSTYTPTSTVTNKPLVGSNTLEGWNYLSTFYGDKPLIKSYPYSDNLDKETDIMYSAFEQIDPRTIPYEFFATGDILPSSKLRWNNMLYHSLNFDNFGIALEKAPSITGSTTHELYDGATQQTEKTENMFENSSIKSASITTNNVRRWGVVRLVEATFDWHFNPIDFEALKPVDEIPRIKNFEYVVMQKPATDTGAFVIASDTSVTSSTGISENEGDMFYDIQHNGANTSEIDGVRQDNQLNGFIATRKFNDTWTVNDLITGSSQTFGEGSPYDYILRFDGIDEKHYGVESFRLYSSLSDYTWDLQFPPNDTDFQTKRQSGDYDIKFSNVLMLRPNLDLGVGMLRYGYLEDGDGSHTYQPPNIFLPILPIIRDTGNAVDRNFSPFHHSNSWHGEETQSLHMSRVINALIERTLSEESGTSRNITIEDKLGMGISATTDDYFSHIYDNCIGLFRQPNNLLTGEKMDIEIMSSQLELDTDANYHSFIDGHDASTSIDQHTRNTTIFPDGHWTDGGIAMIGTKTKNIHWLQSDGERPLLDAQYQEFTPYFNQTAKRTTHHDAIDNNNYGRAMSAQFIVKPKFDLTEQNGVDVLTGNKDVEFELGYTSKHSWLSFMPDLTGYYLVSENVTRGSTSKNCCLKEIPNGQPKYVGKITAHVIDTAPTTSAIEKHKITLDTALDTSANGVHYRLMRISETTFEDTPDKIEIGIMHDTGLQYNTVSQSAKTGNTQNLAGSNYNYYQESVYSMFMLLDIDNNNGDFMERRTISNSTVPSHFTDGEVIETWITDGLLKYKKKLTVNLTRKIPGSESTEYALVFNYDGKLTGNGVVSFGEIFNVTLNKQPKLGDIKKCHIGNTFSIGTQIEKEIQNIVVDAGLEYDASESFSTKTGNIVNTISSSTITCVDAIENVAANDILYSHDGHLVGKVSSISGSDITFSKLYYTPLKYDELIKIEIKTFVTNLNLNNLDVYSALNSLVSKRGLDYTLKDGVFRTRNIDDVHSMRRYSLSALKDYDKIIEIKTNKSLFDVYDEVIIFGDGVTHKMTRIIDNKKDAKRIIGGRRRTLRYTDMSITTETEARVRAIELLDLHSDETLKINLKLHREGLELLEAGDIMSLNFETKGIPSDDYMVFEIENMLAGELSIVVGTFDKTIAERLVEIQTEETKNTIAAITENSEGATSSSVIFDEIELKHISVKYTISQGASNSNIGFDDLVGFTETFGFAESTQTIDTYDSEDWVDVVEETP